MSALQFPVTQTLADGITVDGSDIGQQAFIQYVTSDQENVDPQGASQQQILMVQPITIAADGTLQFQDGQQLDPSQVQILTGTGDQQLFDTSQLVAANTFDTQGIDNQTLHQLQIDSTGQLVQIALPVPEKTEDDITHVQIVKVSDMQDGSQQVLYPGGTQVATQQALPPVSFRRRERDVEPPDRKGPHKCETCGKEFEKWGQLRRHIKIHNDEKEYKCTECTLSFNYEENLKLHLATHNPGNPVCPECGKKFHRLASLKAHLMLHERDESVMCPECGDEFAVQSQLNAHLAEHREVEMGVKYYNCRHCTLQFRDMALLREHSKRHNKIKASLQHKSYRKNIDRSRFYQKCTKCDKSFQKPSQLLRHMRIHTGERPYKCSQCDKAFNQKGALQIHMAKHTGSKEHVCQFCNKGFAQKGNLRSHIQRVHNKPDDDEPYFQCQECSCMFRKLGSLNAHLSREHSGYPIMIEPEAGQTLIKQASEPPLATQIQSLLDQENQQDQAEGQVLAQGQGHTVVTKIEKDASGTKSDADIIKQALESSGLSSTQQSQTSSLAPDAGTSSKPEAGAIALPQPAQAPQQVPSDQMKVNVDNQVPLSLLQRLPENKREGCIATMSIHDPTTGQLKRHIIRRVRGVRWHQCNYCTKEFKKPSDLMRHVRIHTHEKPYRCVQCFRAFAVKSTLTAHLKVHSGVKDYSCHVCEKQFSTHGSLKVHLRLHTGDKPFGCPHCDKRFRTSGHRKTHMELHFRSQQPYSVKPPRRHLHAVKHSKPSIPLPDVPLQEPIMITDQGLVQQAPKEVDHLLQSGEDQRLDRPYKCPTCHRRFKKSSHLKQHIRSHTGEKPYKCMQCFKSFVSNGVLKAHIRTHNGVKNFRCHVCEMSFTTKGSLQRHVSVHTENRPFMCPYCQKTFKRAVYCKKHMKIHKAELGMQALREQQQAQLEAQPETEVTIGEVEDDVVDDVMNDNMQFLTVNQDGTTGQDFTQGIQLSDNQGEIQLTNPDGSSAGVINQNTLNQLQQNGLQQSLLDNAIVTDVQLQSAIQQQEILTSQDNTQQQMQTHQVIQATTQLTQQANTQHNMQPQQQYITQLSDGSFYVETAPQHANNANVQHITLQTQPNMDVVTMEQVTNDAAVISANNIQQLLANSEVTETTMTAAGLEGTELLQDDDDLTAFEQDDLTDATYGERERRTYKCGQCSKTFKKSSHLTQHLRMHRGDRHFKCPHCQKYFVTAGVLKTHLKTHLGAKEFECNICSASFTTNGSLKRHMVTHENQEAFSCPHCTETFASAFLAKKHIRSHQVVEEEVVPTRRTRSTAVLRITDEQAEVLTHTLAQEDMSLSEKILIESAAERARVSEMRGSERANEEEIKKGPKHANQCEFCPKTFKKPSDLARHLRIHTGEKPFGCDMCGRSFTVKSTLDSHLKTHSATDKNFRCHVCTSSFSTKGSLKVHMRLHTGAKPFVCPHCNQRFRTSGHRKSHVALHYRSNNDAAKRRLGMYRLPRGRKISLLPQKALIKAEEAQQGGDMQPVPLPEEATLQTGVTQEGQQQDLSTQPLMALDSASQPVLQLDPLAVQAQSSGVLPVSLSINVADPNVTAQVLQGLEGMQLQLGGQGIQITGLDARMLSQPLQIDASMLQQLQAGQNISLTLNPPPQLIQQQQMQQQQMQQQIPATDPNFVQTNTVQTLDPAAQNAVLNQVTQVQTLEQQTLNREPSPAPAEFMPDDPGIELVGGEETAAGLNINMEQPQLPVSASQSNLTSAVVMNANLSNSPQDNSLVQNVPSLDISQINTSQLNTSQLNTSQLNTSQLNTSQFNTSQLNTSQLNASQILTIEPDQNLLNEVNSAVIASQNGGGLYATQLDPSQLEQLQLVSGIGGLQAAAKTDEEQANQIAATAVSQPEIKFKVLDEPIKAPHPPQPSAADINPVAIVTQQHEDPSSLTSSDETSMAPSGDDVMSVGAVMEGDNAVMKISHAGTSQMANSLGTAVVTTTANTGVDEGERVHQCGVCNKAFKRLSHLKEHVHIHSDSGPIARNKPSSQVCEICNKAFQKPSQLSRHMRIHTGERPYRCEVCGKSFNQKNTLQIHVKKHTGEKPYQCEYCSMTFTQKGNLKTHVKRHHHNEMLHRMSASGDANSTTAPSSGATLSTSGSHHVTHHVPSIPLALPGTSAVPGIGPVDVLNLPPGIQSSVGKNTKFVIVTRDPNTGKNIMTSTTAVNLNALPPEILQQDPNLSLT